MEKQIKKILEKLESNNYQAYLVGGFVRDYLLGIKSYDVDICTNALPRDVHSIFNSVKNNYGSVNLKIEKYNVDITTFRKDYDYVNRRPSRIQYIDSLEEDLKRRDFTINAICMNKNGKVIDLLNGVSDLNKRTIRMIGDINKKITEDPLRILRAIRFATVLDFELEDNLKRIIKENSKLVKNLSKERVKKELDKILISKNYYKGIELLKELNIAKMLDIEFKNINYVDDLLGMWAQLNVKNMSFTNIEKSNIIKIANVLKEGTVSNKELYNYGLYPCTIAGKILNIHPKKINKMYQKLPIKARNDIDVDVKYLGFGVEISRKYKILEDAILSGKLKNKNKEIIKYLERV